ncbi:MAG: MauE/DoxX family redox-associated membrane protein [Mycobacterium sp.]
MPETSAESTSQRSAYRMAVMLIVAGAGHFLAPKPFDTIVPAELPGGPRFYTLASGVAEIGVGGLLLVPRTRRLGAAAAVALFLAVLPANINMVRLWRDKPLPMRIGALARLPMQIPMIVAALRIRRNAPLRG